LLEGLRKAVDGMKAELSQNQGTIYEQKVILDERATTINQQKDQIKEIQRKEQAYTRSLNGLRKGLEIQAQQFHQRINLLKQIHESEIQQLLEQ
jgi:adenylosuccinate lyase